MAYEAPGAFKLSFVAGADLRTSQNCFVNLDTTAAGCKIALPSAGARAIGVLQNKPNSGEVGEVVTFGIAKVVVATGGVTAGDNVKVLADGKVTTVTTGTFVVGIALATGVAGVTVPVLLTLAAGGGLSA